jgi:hypothetical protein
VGHHVHATALPAVLVVSQDQEPKAGPVVTTCRTPDEAFAAGQADADADPPLDQDQADLVAVILAPSQAAEEAA